jgi:hypothetical protein
MSTNTKPKRTTHDLEFKKQGVQLLNTGGRPLAQIARELVKKLLQQRRRTGDIAPRHHYSGRKPMILDSHCRQIETLLHQNPDITLKELRRAVALKCSLPAIHYALLKIGQSKMQRK